MVSCRGLPAIFGCGRFRFAAGICALGLVSCGPSVQYIYEGNIRFEHCYRLDLDPPVSPLQRRACWRDWLDNYAEGQTRDRIEYAQRRLDALQSGKDLSISLRIVDPPEPLEAVDAVAEAPAPSSAHAPPPPRAAMASPPAEDVDTSSDPAKTVVESLKLVDCSAHCIDSWNSCREAPEARPETKKGPANPADAPTSKEREVLCSRDFMTCMTDCYKE